MTFFSSLYARNRPGVYFMVILYADLVTHDIIHIKQGSIQYIVHTTGHIYVLLLSNIVHSSLYGLFIVHIAQAISIHVFCLVRTLMPSFNVRGGGGRPQHIKTKKLLGPPLKCLV
jgi:hypothetical protein